MLLVQCTCYWNFVCWTKVRTLIHMYKLRQIDDLGCQFMVPTIYILCTYVSRLRKE